jgi:cell division protein FtsZ
MTIKLHVPKPIDLKPRITVIGVGGAGGNAVNNMIAAGLPGVDFIVANTDAQALVASKAPHRIQLGINLTEGLGAGSKPEVGEAAAQEAEDELRSRISGAHMLFIAAGMGGGTGTGAAAVIARIAQELGVLTVAVVTRPFQFEGTRRMRIADAGVVELKKHVDTLIVIPNQNLFNIANERTTFAEAFVLADQVLYSGIACIVDLIVKDGLINLDLADVRTVLTGMGPAVMGTGEASGDRRAVVAAEEAITNQLLDNMNLTGAKGLLLSIIGGRDLTLFEVDEAASRVRLEVDPEANIIVGAAFDETMGDRVRVSIVASGMPMAGGLSGANQQPVSRPVAKVALDVDVARATLPASGLPLAPIDAAQMSRGSATPPPLPQHTPPPAPGPRHDPSGYATPHNANGWISPDNITVRETLTHSGLPQPTMRPIASNTPQQQPQRGSGFTAQPPAEARRAPSRVPDIDDFPAIGQKEYRAKSGQFAQSEVAQSATVPAPVLSRAEPRKGSLFQRLADVARGKSKSVEPASEIREDEPLPDFFAKQKRQS